MSRIQICILSWLENIVYATSDGLCNRSSLRAGKKYITDFMGYAKKGLGLSLGELKYPAYTVLYFFGLIFALITPQCRHN